MAKQWSEVSRIVPAAGNDGKNVLRVAFWIWGCVGLFVTSIELGSALSSRNTGQGVGVGTSAFIMMEAVFWIGGMVLFGIGGLLARADMSLQRSIENESTESELNKR